MIEKIKELLKELEKMELEERIETINEIKKELHKYSPFQYEPVDCVIWVKKDIVQANDYNPNKVAPKEMELLHISIKEDGYTQPIVGFREDENKITVVDGFHRHRVGKEYQDITERVKGYLPVVIINEDRTDKADRIASTIRHNRARGKHEVTAMSEIVLELARRNWSNEKIAKELGMEPDEVLRLKQITGLAELFKDREFSQAWEAEEEDV